MLKRTRVAGGEEAGIRAPMVPARTRVRGAKNDRNGTKVRATFVLDKEVNRCLRIAAAVKGKDQSTLVDAALIRYFQDNQLSQYFQNNGWQSDLEAAIRRIEK